MRRGVGDPCPSAHLYITMGGGDPSNTFLKKFKKILNRTFVRRLAISLYMDIYAHARTHARIPQCGACHKFGGAVLDTKRTQFERSFEIEQMFKIRQIPTRENLKALFRVESCRKS